jgi:hypothetical protein
VEVFGIEAKEGATMLSGKSGRSEPGDAVAKIEIGGFARRGGGELERVRLMGPKSVAWRRSINTCNEPAGEFLGQTPKEIGWADF